MITTLFERIAKIQPGLPGWCTPAKAATLAGIVIGYRPLLSVEIGVYGGSSFLPIAMAHQAIGYGTAVGIDAWDKTVAIQAQTENASRVWWDNQDYEGLYNGVLNQIAANGLGNVAQIVRNKSSLVQVPIGIGLCHVDGAHNDEAVRDVVRYCSNVLVGGFVVMDDLKWAGGGPARAAQRLMQMGFKMLYELRDGQDAAVFQRTR